MNKRNSTHSLSEFKRSSVALLERITESGEPVVLTVNGEAKLVVQDAASYQRLVESIDYSEAVKGVRRGLDDIEQGRTKPVKQAFAELRKQHRPVRTKRR